MLWYEFTHISGYIVLVEKHTIEEAWSMLKSPLEQYSLSITHLDPRISELKDNQRWYL